MRLLTNSSFSPPLSAWLERGKHHGVCGRRVFVIDCPPTHAGAAARGAERAPLVLLHGFPTSSFDYHLVLPQLAQHRRVVLFDLPGFGFSDKPEHYSYSLFEQADIVEALLARLGITRPHILAHDLGVSIACELLARRQRKLLKGELASLTLMSAGIYSDLARVTPSQKILQTPVGGMLASLGVGAVFKLQMQQVFTRPVADDEFSAMWEQILYLDGHKRLAQIASYIGERERFEERWINALRTNEECPVHLVWGSRDPTARYAIAERLAEELPHVALTRLSKVGHYPHLEAPDEAAYAIDQWLAQRELTGARADVAE
jgi:pimeloyl-ACP methyl ester carboxylesterase